MSNKRVSEVLDIDVLTSMEEEDQPAATNNDSGSNVQDGVSQQNQPLAPQGEQVDTPAGKFGNDWVRQQSSLRNFRRKPRDKAKRSSFRSVLEIARAIRQTARILKPFDLDLRASIKKVSCLVCFWFPLVALLISAIFSVLLLVFAEWTTEEGFLEVFAEISGANPRAVVPDTNFVVNSFMARLIVSFAGFFSIGVYGCLVGAFSGGPIDRPFAEKLLNFKYDKKAQLVRWMNDYDPKDVRRPLHEVVAKHTLIERNEGDLEGETTALSLTGLDLGNEVDYYRNTHFAEWKNAPPDEFRGLAMTTYGCFACVVFPLVAVAVSIFFGGLLFFTQQNNEWSFGDGFFTVLQQILDMKLEVVEPPAIDSIGGKVIFCLISLWGLGYFVLVLGQLAGPLLMPIVLADGEPLFNEFPAKEGLSQKMAESICTVVGILFPLGFGIAAIGIGLVYAAIGGYPAGPAIFEVYAELTNMRTIVADTSPDGSGRLVGVLIGMISVVLFACTLGLMSFSYGPGLIHQFNMNPVYESEKNKHPLLQTWGKIFLFICVAIPLFAATISCLFGGMLFGLEKIFGDEAWTFGSAFFLIFSELLDIEIEIYDLPPIEHGFSKLILAIVGAWSYGLFSLILSVLSGPIILPLVHAYAGTTHDIFKSDYFEKLLQE